MVAMIEVEQFCVFVKLPDGLRFREWTPGCTLMPKMGNGQYLDTSMMAVERISDDVFSTIEISQFKKLERGKVHVSVSELSQAVDKAIAELEA